MTAAHGRRAAPRGRRPGPALLAAWLLPLLCLGLVVLVRPAPPAGPATDPAGTGPAAAALVERTTLVCPAAEPSERARVQVGSAPVPGLGSAGTVTLGGAGGPGHALSMARGAVAGRPARGVQVVDATGDLAAGLFAARGVTRGATLGCSAPRAEWWFVGAGATVDHTSVLTLTNAEVGPAVVDVRVFGPDGEVDAVGTRGLTLAPGETRSLPLTDVAPRADDLAVGVRASRGRVVAAISDRRGFAATSSSWLPSGHRPSRVVRLAGLPGEVRRGTLLVGNPSPLEAQVEVTVNGGAGAFTPAGLEQLRVPPGAVAALDLRSVLRGPETIGLLLRSRVPVLAAARVGGSTVRHAGAVLPVVGSAAVVLPGRGSVAQLTAGGLPAEAALVALDTRGEELASHRLALPAGATDTWTVPRRATYLMLTREHGTLWGAVAGPAGTLPLASLPVRVRSPEVVPALR